jgi:hypothetical protein
MLRFARLFPLLGAMLLSSVLLIQAATTPRPLADVTIDLPGGQRARLKDGKGKVRVIALISTECEHCAKTVGILSKMYTTYKAKGVDMVGAAVNEDSNRLLEPFLAKNKPAFKIGLLSQSNTRRLAEFGTSEHPFVPILLFVDRNNTVQFQFYGDDQIFKAQEIAIKGVLDAMLKQK